MAVDKKPTIKDVASHAQVSKSTVSLVLQNSPLVKDRTRKAVQEAMLSLGYVRNRAAATLRGSGTGLVGLIINDLRNPFFTEFATSVQMALADRGLATVIANCDENPDIQTRTIMSMLEHDVSGLIISPCYGNGSEGFQAIERMGLPALQVLRQIETGAAPLPFFSHDYRSGSYMAVQHLLSQGMEKIAFVGGLEGLAITQERMSGYLNEMSRHGLPTAIFHGPSTRAFGRNTVRRLLDDYPDIEAAICFNDLVAMGMHSGLAVEGRTLGKDFFLVGFDDIEEAQLVYPALSTIRCNVTEFGILSAKKLYETIETGTQPVPEETLPVELVVRTSSRRS